MSIQNSVEKEEKRKRKKEQTLYHIQGLSLPFTRVTDLTTVFLAIQYEGAPICLSLSFIFSFCKLLIANTPNEIFWNIFFPCIYNWKLPEDSRKLLGNRIWLQGSQGKVYESGAVHRRHHSCGRSSAFALPWVPTIPDEQPEMLIATRWHLKRGAASLTPSQTAPMKRCLLSKPENTNISCSLSVNTTFPLLSHSFWL